jgi:hypothetical protein
MSRPTKLIKSYCCNAVIHFYSDDLNGFCTACEREIISDELRHK